MFKNQLQELAQRSCFNLPSYACIREGPDHAPRFKASVNFNGEIFESPSYCTTLRQAEHAAAEVALNVLSTRGPSRSLTARVLDETGVYKNLLQETAHRAGLKLPVYTTIRSGPGHVPVFTCTVELAAMNFTGEPAKTKKQAEKNAAIAAWSALKRMPNLDSLTNKETDQDQDQAIVARVLSNFRSKDDNNRNNNARRRDQNQAAARGRMVRGYRDSSTVSTASSSSSGTNSLLQYQQQWRLLDLLMDSVSLEGSNQQNSFVSLLPPPPPRTTSKILPPPSQSSNRHIPIQVRVNHNNNSQLKVQEFPGLLEEHQRDEEEWLGKKPESSSSCSVYGNHKQFPQANNNRLFGSVNHPMYTGGSLFNPQRMAPAVQIRSVIPVCAAPPMKEASSSPSTSSMSTQKGAEEVSKFNNNNNPTHSSYNYEEKRQ